jgi:Tol biopolymer transport system component
MNRRACAFLVVVAVTGGLLDLAAAQAQPVTVSRVSVDAAGGDANGVSDSPSVSGDGRRVAFGSLASDIAGGDPSDNDVYLRDRTAGTTALVDVDPVGAGQPAVSDDGRYVAFLSDVGTPDGPTHVFVRDLEAGSTTLVDVGLDGGVGNNGSSRVSMSGDGRHVAFVSDASDLVVGDGNDQPDVFVRDLDAGTTVRATVDTTGGDSGAAEFGSRLFADSPDVLSADGRYVVFVSPASDLVVGDEDADADVFVRDLATRVTTLASDAPEVAVVLNPTISPDGRRVAYTNAHFGLVRGGDVLVRDRIGGATVKANIGTGDPASFSFSTASFSGNGRYVAFDSTPVNQDAGDNTPVDSNVFVRDLDAGNTTRASVATGGGEPNGSSFDPDISADGKIVGFVSGASDLVAGDGNALRDVFVADLGQGGARNQLVALGELIEGIEIPKGAQNSLTAEVRSALAALDRGDTAASCGNLHALVNHARAQSGKALSSDQTEQIISRADSIRALLGCI